MYIHAKIKYSKNNKIDTVSFGTFEGWPWAMGIRPMPYALVNISSHVMQRDQGGQLLGAGRVHEAIEMPICQWTHRKVEST
jgi:hypothetical protein